MSFRMRLAAALLYGSFLAGLPVMAQTAATDAESQAKASSSDSKTDSYVLHVNVKLVNVFTNVTDATGAIVGGLTKDDFSISEDGRPQRIAVFDRQSELPL